MSAFDDKLYDFTEDNLLNIFSFFAAISSKRIRDAWLSQSESQRRQGHPRRRTCCLSTIAWCGDIESTDLTASSTLNCVHVHEYSFSQIFVTI